MHRRLFLAGAGGAVASLPLGAHAEPAGRPAHDLPLLRSYITNREQFPDASIAHEDQNLYLTRRPERKYSSASIAVSHPDGKQVGYLPLDSTGVLAVLLDEGFMLYAEPLSQGATGYDNLPVQIYWRRYLHEKGLPLNS